LIADFQHLRSALRGREAELHEEERQVDSEVSRGCDAAVGFGMEKALFCYRKLFRSQGFQPSHAPIVLWADQSRSSAAFSPASTSCSSADVSAPTLLISLARSSVVTRWQIATFVFGRPAAPPGISIAVNPRLACDSDVERGTTMMERQFGAWLNPSCETITTGYPV
jgi:hypothetical protein